MKKFFPLISFCLPFFFFCTMLHAQLPTLTWAKKMGGISSDIGLSIAVDVSGNVYTTGYFEGTVDFDPGVGIVNLTSAGFSDVFISKSDPAGNLVWAKNVGGNTGDGGNSIAVDIAGNVYTTGYFQGIADFDPGVSTVNITSLGFDDIFILKLNASGNFVWAKNIGGSDDDEGSSIAVDGSGIYTTGFFAGTVDFDPGNGTVNLVSAGFDDIFVLKLDASGNFVWAKKIGGPDYDNGISLTLFSGNVYTTGIFNGTVDFDPGAGILNLTSSGGEDIFISKLDALGNFVWAKNMGGALNEECYSITTDVSGVYTTGVFEGIADFDPGPGTFNLTSAGNFDIFISKLDHSGNYLWAKSCGSALYDDGNSIAVDGSGVYITGSFAQTVDFDPGLGITNLTADLDDIFILKLNSSGNFVWAIKMGGTDNEVGKAIAVANNNVYSTGYFNGTADFDPGNGTFNLTSNGTGDIYVVKLASPPTSALYFRSKQTGNWNNVNTWESSSDNINWVNASITPDANATSIVIINTHTVTVTANVTVGPLFVNPGSSLITSSGIILNIQ